jgi:hypothetical protein
MANEDLADGAATPVNGVPLAQLVTTREVRAPLRWCA